MNSNIKILLIEDNHGDAFLTKFYLEESGLKYEYFHSERLSDGLEILKQEQCDVVLVDLGLPDSNGIETLHAVLDSDENCVVIV